MTTPLPDGDTSARDLLARFVPWQTTVQFDWQRLATAVQPGEATVQQQAQRARMFRVQAQLRAWALRWGFPATHSEASAVFAVGAAQPTATEYQLMALARLIFWIYTLDSHIDRQAPRAVRGGDPAAILARMDCDLATAYAPLRHMLTRGERRTHHLDLPWSRRSQFPLCQALGTALAAWLHDLPDCWPEPFKGIARRRHLVAVNLAACVGMMRQEFQWDAQFNVAPEGALLPSLTTYLAAARRSIGVFPISALAATFDRHPLARWRQSLAAVRAGGLVVRLANDIATYATDTEEGNVTAVTLMLARLGMSCQAPADSAEARRALGALVPVLDSALARFSAAQATLREGSLSHTLRQVVALALAIYGSGDRYRGEASAGSTGGIV